MPSLFMSSRAVARGLSPLCHVISTAVCRVPLVAYLIATTEGVPIFRSLISCGYS